MQEVLDILIQLAAKRFERDAGELTPETDFFEHLGIDSYQAMELLTDIEEEYDIEIPDYEIQGVTTFAALAEVIQNRL